MPETLQLTPPQDDSEEAEHITDAPQEAVASPDDAKWDYTAHFKDHRQRHGLDSDTFKGRRLIERDGPIDGGVYTGTYGGEAIVVDSEKYPSGIDRLMAKVEEGITDETGKKRKEWVLETVFDVVGQTMPYSQEGVDNLLSKVAKEDGLEEFKDGTKVGLEYFISEGVGVCRHQALTAGLLLEKLKSNGVIRGSVSVDRNMVWNPMKDKYDGHAWVRYTTKAGEIYILDIAQDYFGRLEDSEGELHGWDYMRPEEKASKPDPRE